MQYVRRQLTQISQRAIFSPRIELLNLSLPLLFVFISLMAGVPATSTDNEKFVMRMLAANLFGNSYHIVYSFWNLRYMEEFKTAHRNLKFHAWVWPAVFILIFVFFMLSHDRGFAKDIYPLRLIAVWLICLIPALHGRRQSMGLSLLYNMNQSRDLKKDETTDFARREARSRRWEHRAATLMVLGTFATQLSARNVQYRILDKKLIFEAGVFTTVAGIAALIAALAFLKPYRSLVKIKGIFSVRYLLLALLPFSPIALNCNAALHGFEYTLLQGHMMKRSKSLRQLSAPLLVPLALMLVFEIAIDLSGTYRRLGWLSNGSVENVMVIIAASFVYLHYAFDSVYFRLGNPVVRQSILPLLERGEKPQTNFIDLSAINTSDISSDVA